MFSPHFFELNLYLKTPWHIILLTFRYCSWLVTIISLISDGCILGMFTSEVGIYCMSWSLTSPLIPYRTTSCKHFRLILQITDSIVFVFNEKQFNNYIFFNSRSICQNWQGFFWGGKQGCRFESKKVFFNIMNSTSFIPDQWSSVWFVNIFYRGLFAEEWKECGVISLWFGFTLILMTLTKVFKVKRHSSDLSLRLELICW